MRIKAKVKKMTDAEAMKVSLVRRSASRIPFRVVKFEKNTEEKGMITLGLQRILKKSDNTASAPRIAAMVVQKADASDELKSKIEALGFEIGEVVENDDDTVMYVSKGETVDGKDETVVRQSDDLLVIMKGFAPYTEDLKDFAEIVAAQGFYSGVQTASQVLNNQLCDTIYKAASPAEASKGVGALVEAYKGYVTGLVSALPTVAFKTEGVIAESKAEAVKKAEAEKATKTEVKKSAAQIEAEELAKKAEELANQAKEAAKKAEEAAENAKTSEHSEDGSDDAGKTGEDKSTNEVDPTKENPVDQASKGSTLGKDAALESDNLSKVIKSELDKIVQSMESVRNEIVEIRKQQEENKSSLDTAIKKSEDLEKRLGSTVLVSPTNEDVPGKNGTVKKTEYVPLGDTAFSQKARKFR